MSEHTLAKHLAATGLGLFFLNVGIAHFTDPAWFEPIVPPVLGDARFWVYASGVAEILVGVGLLVPENPPCSGHGYSGHAGALVLGQPPHVGQRCPLGRSYLCHPLACASRLGTNRHDRRGFMGWQLDDGSHCVENEGSRMASCT